MDNLTFTIVVQKDLSVRATTPDGDEHLGNLDLDSSRRELIATFDSLVREGKLTRLQEIEQLGKLLYDTLFDDETASLFERSLDALPSGASLKMRLVFEDELSEIARLPWEYLYSPPSASRPGFFFASRTDLVLSRYVGTARPPRRPVEGPLRVLVFDARPRERAVFPAEPVIEALQELTQDLEIELMKPVAPTAKDLSDGLIEYQPHVLHLMSHGRYDSATEQTQLALETEDGILNWVDESTLADLIRASSKIRLVILSTLESARFATSLIRGAKVQAVVAMQYPIPFRLEVGFYKVFYREVMRGVPIDLAFQTARGTLMGVPGVFGIPALFVRRQQESIIGMPPLTTLQPAEPDWAFAADVIMRLATDHVEWLSDAPASQDFLERRPLARALATRIQRIHDEDPDISFLIHIDGPWGSGKTTLLNFLRDALEPRWMVITFDAWRQSQVGPPWWSLLAALRRRLDQRQGCWDRLTLRIVESWVRIRRGGAGFLLAIIIFALLAVGIFFVLQPDDVTSKSVEELAKAVTASVAALGVLWAGARVASKLLLWDSATGAQLFEQSNADPMGNVSKHFRWLAERAGRPVMFFIDDLDRCSAEYVVGLLEAIQTLVRDVSPRDVSRQNHTDGSDRIGPHFVVAADGSWIRDSFETKYDNFADAVGEPGRPLGYLFLDKLFQLTVPIPLLSFQFQSSYLERLLSLESDHDRQALETEEKEVRERIETSTTDSQVVETLRHTDPRVRARVAAAAIEKLSSREVEKAREHALQKFAPLLERNPRAMKRFINTYSIVLAVQMLQPRPVDTDSLALWTILKTRWPALADFLQTSPDAIASVGAGDSLPEETPKDIKDLLNSHDLIQLVNFQDTGPLTEDLIRACLGTTRTREQPFRA
jgi:hypothetical protein